METISLYLSRASYYARLSNDAFKCFLLIVETSYRIKFYSLVIDVRCPRACLTCNCHTYHGYCFVRAAPAPFKFNFSVSFGLTASFSRCASSPVEVRRSSALLGTAGPTPPTIEGRFGGLRILRGTGGTTGQLGLELDADVRELLLLSALSFGG